MEKFTQMLSFGDTNLKFLVEKFLATGFQNAITQAEQLTFLTCFIFTVR